MCCTGKDRVRNLTPRQKFRPNQPVVVEAVPIKLMPVVVEPAESVRLSEVEPKVAPHTGQRKKRKKRTPREIKIVKANEVFRELGSVQLEK